MSVSLLSEGSLGPLTARNRLVRAGTSETMATPAGTPTDELVALYSTLADGGVGVVVTGHLFCHARGRYAPRQTGIDDDERIAGLRRLTGAVHRAGGLILAQLAHAGSQSRVSDVAPVAPSAVPNELTGRRVPAAREDEIDEAIAAFASGARRAMEAGFDGVHLHGANGYLISEFLSPLTNRRDDGWGGTPERRARFARAVVGAVRAEVPTDRALTMKLGMVDAAPGGLGLEQSIAVAETLVAAGVDGLEVSCGLMREPSDSARLYVDVDRRRAVEDLLLHRVLSAGASEGYFVPWARRVRERVATPLVVVGGMRRVETMQALVAAGDADFIALARPFIREPTLARQIAEGRTGRVDCTSCNLCLRHEGHHALRCWRIPRRRLLEHAAFRLRGGFTGVLPTGRRGRRPPGTR